MDQRVIDLCALLREVDEVILLELLGVTSSDLVDAFVDKIEEKLELIEGELLDEL